MIQYKWVVMYKWAVVYKDNGEIVRVFPLGGDVGTPVVTQFKWEAKMALQKIAEERPVWKGKIAVVKIKGILR